MSEWTRPAQPVRCKVDLTAPLTVRRERGVLVQGDENANAIVAEVYQANGAPYDLTGATVTLTFVRPDRLAAPPITAEITGENHNIAVATLTDTCYKHSGQYAASLKLHRGETERTILRLIGEIISTGHDGTVDDEQLFPTPEELLETLEKVETARQNAETAASRANTAAARAEQLTIDASGLARDSNRLGGQLPAYYARQSDVDALKAGVEIVPSANGNVIALTDASDRPFRGLTVYGKTTQKTYTGKNLLLNETGSETINGVTYTVNADGSVTVNGTATADSYHVISTTKTVLKAGSYVLNGAVTNAFLRIGYGPDNTYIGYDTARSTGLTFTLSEETYVWVSIRVLSGVSVANKTVCPMIRVASNTDGTYEPYVGGTPSPNPSYPQELVTAGADGGIEVGVPGKNLLKASAGLKAETRNGVTFTPAFDANGELVSVTVNGTASARTDYYILPRQNGPGWISPFRGMTVIGSGCPAGGSSVAADGLYALSFQGFDVNGNAAVDTGNGTRHITVADEVETFDTVQVYIIIFAGCIAKNLVFKPMIRRADESSSAFELYRAQTLPLSAPNGLPGIPVTSGGNYTDAKGQQWVCDEIDLERGVRRTRVQKVEGSQLSFKVADETGYPQGDSLLFAAYLPSPGDAFLTNHRWGLCSHIPYDLDVLDKDADGFYNYQKRLLVRIKGVSDIDTFRGKIEDAIFLIELSIPVETALTAEELSIYRAMHTNHPNTTVFNDSGADMMVRYVADKDLFFDAFEKRVLARAAAQTADQTAALEDAYQEGVNEA